MVADAQAIRHLARQTAGAGDADLDVIRSAWPEAPVDDRGALAAWLAQDPGLARQVGKVDLDRDPGDDDSSGLADSPPLPKAARLDPDLGRETGEWLDAYTDYAVQVSPMTPRSFHESAGLWLASVTIARRLKVPMHFGAVYPNLFVLWLAMTTLYRKTTALDVARRKAQKVIPFLLAAQDTTFEALISDMAGREPAYFEKLTPRETEVWHRERNHAAQRGWVIDEMSGMLAGAGRDYNAGLVEALLRFYDCDQRYTRSTKGQGRVTVNNAYLALLGVSTPVAMAQYLIADRLWAMGFWARFVILTPEGPPEWKTARAAVEPPEIEAGLKRLYDALPEAQWPDPPEALTVTFDDGVYEEWEKYNKALGYDLLLSGEIDPRLFGTYGRLPVNALKVATILAAMGWTRYEVLESKQREKAPRIELAHLARAISICEEWRASAHRALAKATTTVFDSLLERILVEVSRSGSEGVTARGVYRKLGKPPSEVKDALARLVEFGEVEELKVKPEGGGRPTTKYVRLAG